MSMNGKREFNAYQNDQIPVDVGEGQCHNDRNNSSSQAHMKIDSQANTAGRPSITVQTLVESPSGSRRVSTDVQTESGTEADDEKGAFFQPLPGPPSRPRKGLKDPNASSSPLLSPSCLDDKRQHSIIEAKLHDKEQTQATVNVQSRFRRRRRAELLRRITETTLFLLICACVFASTLANSRFYDSIVSTTEPGLVSGQPCTIAFGALVSAIYLLYPCRILFRNRVLNKSKRKPWWYIHIPAAFDPASLLYPVFVPLLISLSTAHSSSETMRLNIVLGTSSIPHRIISARHSAWWDSFRWLLSISPVLLFPESHDQHAANASFKTRFTNNDLLFLYPLHFCLAAVLSELTTTSLLPSEIQLLSIGFINLYLLSTSPQTCILRSLLLTGGLSLTIICSWAFQLELSLAKTPSWRFRRRQERDGSFPASLQALNDTFPGKFEPWKNKKESSTSSDDSSVFETSQNEYMSSRDGKSRKRSVASLNEVKESRCAKKSQISGGSNRTLTKRNDGSETVRFRRFHAQRRRLPKRRGLLPQSLTLAQATALRWILAVYIYVVILFLLSAPIRLFLQRSAFQGREPIGWVLGYLFGDVHQFRESVNYFELQDWIKLAPYPLQHCGLQSWSWIHVKDFRHCLGPTTFRRILCAYYMVILSIGLLTVTHLKNVVEVDTRRKIFHAMMVIMFLPTIFIDPCFVSLAFIIILAAFLLLDLLRASQVPPISGPLTTFLAPFVDGRDHRGPVVVSHIFLLIGCAVPLWLSLTAYNSKEDSDWNGWDVTGRDLSMVAGVVCVGMGDAAASLVGRRYGRHRWCWTGGKSLEGSLAFAIAVILGLASAQAWLHLGGWVTQSPGFSWTRFLVKASLAASGASMTEAVLTGGNDNVIVPIILWLLVRSLGL